MAVLFLTAGVFFVGGTFAVGANLLLAGSSGTGKSKLAAGLLERLTEHLGAEHIRTYQLHLLQKHVSKSIFIQTVCALRFLYETTLGRPWMVDYMPYPKKPKTLPVILSRDEVKALLDAPDRRTWSGRRDAVLFAVFYNTGARVSEIINLRVADVLLDRESALHLRGKGRKERIIPLWKSTAAQLRAWLAHSNGDSDAPVFPNRAGQRLSRSGVEQRLRVTVKKASERCSSLRERRVSPHTLRHTTAMHLLQSGVDITVIALWLGHGDTATTHMYIEADLAMKEAALRRVEPPGIKGVRFKARDRLLAFLEAL
jgi:integrase/recombinase XerD